MAYTEDQNRTSGTSPTFNPGEQFRHVGRGSAIGHASSQAFEDFLQVIASGNDNPNTNSSESK
jgi:hypothetical protein